MHIIDREILKQVSSQDTTNSGSGTTVGLATKEPEQKIATSGSTSLTSAKKEAAAIPVPAQQALTQEDRLIKAIKENDTAEFNEILQNKALFNTNFTKNNYNLTMLVLEHGSSEIFKFYLNLVRGVKKQIKFTQKNTVLLTIFTNATVNRAEKTAAYSRSRN